MNKSDTLRWLTQQQPLKGVIASRQAQQQQVIASECVHFDHYFDECCDSHTVLPLGDLYGKPKINKH
jgi:hypothetical protein